MIKQALRWSTIVGAAAILCISLVFFLTWVKSGYKISLTNGQLFLEWYKAIGIGFLISLLGAIIPHILTEERFAFERFKDSRKVYSLAKTSIIYLPEILPSLDYANAIKKIIDAHRWLHLAETYPNELHKHLHWLHPREDSWVPRNYWEIYAIQKTLAENIDIWPDLGKSKRLRIIRESYQLVEEFFGYDNEKWHDRMINAGKWMKGKKRAEKLMKEKRKAEKEILDIINSKFLPPK
jgi:hypothetical protein